MKNLLLLCLMLSQLPLFAQSIPAFPGAEGFGRNVTGGRGGEVYYVTNLNCSGAGSLADALLKPGKKYILFKVSGVIPCAAEVFQGDVYLAGQTSPGGIIVRGIILDEIYETNTRSRNVIIRHLRSRPRMEVNLPNQGYVLDDGLRLDGASDVIVDHCSFANATDESVQISHSKNITIQNCMLAETIGEHFNLGGMLINYSRQDHPQDNLSIHHNVWNRIGGRFPEFSCESSFCRNAPLNVEVSNNLFWDQQIQTWYNSCTSGGDACKDFSVNLNFVGNRTVARSSYGGPMALVDLVNNTKNQNYISGNTMNLYPNYTDYQLFYCCNDFKQNAPNTSTGSAVKLTARHAFPTITYTPSSDLVNYATKNVGAFPRDPMDRRLLDALSKNTLDTRPVDGKDYYNDAFKLDFTTMPAAPTDTDSDGMPDDWEKTNGLNPNIKDHNGTELSVKLTGLAGYTNLECYLNQLSDKLTNSTPVAPAPAISATSNSPIQAGGTVNLSASVQNGTASGFAWKGPTNFTSTQQNPSIQNATSGVSGVYSVSATVSNSTLSATVSVEVSTITGDEPKGDFTVKIFPNPNSGEFVVEVKNPPTEVWTFILRNTQGQVIMRENNLSSVSVPGWVQAGTYPYVVRSGNQVKRGKVLIMK